MKKAGILGSGPVGQALGQGLINYGYQVMIGSRDPGKIKGWNNNENASTGTFQEAAEFGDIIIISVKGSAAKDVVKLVKDKLRGKTVIDTTNPIADAAPENGVLLFFTKINQSLMEELQELAPDANFVKAFSCIGNTHMVNPHFDQKPSMFICGNNPQAKKEASEIISSFGHEVEDMGTAQAARAIEPLCMLWCIPGFISNEWNHAFRLMKES